MAKPKDPELQDKIQYQLLQTTVKPDDKLLNATLKDRMILAGLGAIGAMALGAVIPKLIGGPILKRHLFSGAAVGATSGFTAPMLHDIILKEKRGYIPKGQGQKEYVAVANIKRKIGSEIEEFPELFKQSAFLGTVFRKGTSLIGKGLGGAAGAIGQGLRGAKPVYMSKGVRKVPLGSKIWSYGVRGGVGAGAIYGGVKLHNRFGGKKLSGQNYTTMLRNNMLAGNIRPGEVSTADLSSVQKIGMR